MGYPFWPVGEVCRAYIYQNSANFGRWERSAVQIYQNSAIFGSCRVPLFGGRWRSQLKKFGEGEVRKMDNVGDRELRKSGRGRQ